MTKSKNPLKGLKVSYIEVEPLPDGHVEYRKKQYEEIKNNKDVIIEVLRQGYEEPFEYISDELKKDKEFFLFVPLFKFFSMPLISTTKVIMPIN